MIQQSGRVRLVLELLGELVFGYFQRDDAVEARVTGFIHLSHAACAYQR
jgi:hypothetical protein